MEKEIEKGIIQYLTLKWAVVEWMQSWSVIVKKWKYTHKMILQWEGCPDITCFYKWEYIWIEVKKDQDEVDHWLKQEKRFHDWIEIPKSYKREYFQIKYKQRILQNFWTFILTCDIKEVIEYIEKLDKKSKKDLQLK